MKMVQRQNAAQIEKTMRDLENEEGSMSIDKFWKLKKKLSTKETSKSSIIVNGKEIAADTTIIKEYEKEFSKRLAHKTISKEFAEYEKTTEKLV